MAKLLSGVTAFGVKVTSWCSGFLWQSYYRVYRQKVAMQLKELNKKFIFNCNQLFCIAEQLNILLLNFHKHCSNEYSLPLKLIEASKLQNYFFLTDYGTLLRTPDEPPAKKTKVSGDSFIATNKLTSPLRQSKREVRKRRR